MHKILIGLSVEKPADPQLDNDWPNTTPKTTQHTHEPESTCEIESAASARREETPRGNGGGSGEGRGERKDTKQKTGRARGAAARDGAERGGRGRAAHLAPGAACSARCARADRHDLTSPTTRAAWTGRVRADAQTGARGHR